jgi:hypothetical protein
LTSQREAYLELFNQYKKYKRTLCQFTRKIIERGKNYIHPLGVSCVDSTPKSLHKPQNYYAKKKKMLRYQVFLTHSIVFLSIWLFDVLKVLEKSEPESDGHAGSTTSTQQQQQQQQQMVRTLRLYAPVWMILGLGIYLFLRLILGVLAFRDCPDAASELEAEIVQAKIELRKRKILPQ